MSARQLIEAHAEYPDETKVIVLAPTGPNLTLGDLRSLLPPMTDPVRREEIARALWESDETLYLESGRLPWEKATPGDRAAAYRRADAILSLPAPAPAPVSSERWAESIVQSFDALVIDWSPLHEQRAEVLSGLRSILLASPPGAADLKEGPGE